jgi:hypothetical protein
LNLFVLAFPQLQWRCEKTDISDYSGGTVTASHRVPFAGIPLGCYLTRFIGTGGKIDLLAALGAFVGLVEFVGKNLFGFTTFRAFTGKGFQLFEIFKSGAMLRCAHDALLFLGLSGYCLWR